MTVASSAQQQVALEETFTLLLGVVLERRYQDWRKRQGIRDKVVFAAIWLCIIGASSAWVAQGEVWRVVVRTLPIAVFAGVTLSLAYGLVHICRS
eukprot:CAMPEP_0176136808 /NCGR_PEP_ID=MMETSP0120_2-20121206/69438_1 /TAXON_ID=160619 /ORGANISM="Kryptoperidinium foliaceum, Strain CCMP 1326" /LENGTH=94 /DNA_ID=CAMNT_0017472609 /DNA_START=7 /DNA_END=288 /DNA_ORIENTATION=+